MMAGFRSGRKVHLDKDSRRRGHDASARSICLVCYAEWLKIRQTGQKREPPLMMPRFMWAAAYRSHRAWSHGVCRVGAASGVHMTFRRRIVWTRFRPHGGGIIAGTRRASGCVVPVREWLKTRASMIVWIFRARWSKAMSTLFHALESKR